MHSTNRRQFIRQTVVGAPIALSMVESAHTVHTQPTPTHRTHMPCAARARVCAHRCSLAATRLVILITAIGGLLVVVVVVRLHCL